MTDGPVTISENYGGTDAYGPHYTSSLWGLAQAHSKQTYDESAKKVNYSFDYANFWGMVSSNVIKLDDKTFLLVAYRLVGAVDLNVGSNAPVVAFNGKKYDDYAKKAPEGKIDRNNSCIQVEAAIVKQEAGKEPIVIANSASFNSAKKPKRKIEVSVKPKNNIYANVSMNRTRDSGGKDLGYVTVENPYLKSGTYPYFNISIKLNPDKADTDLKAAKKLLSKGVDQANAKLMKAEFKFDICQNGFAWAEFDKMAVADFKDTDPNHYDGNDYDTGESLGFRHLYPFPSFRDNDKRFKELIQDDPEKLVDNAGYKAWIGERCMKTDNNLSVGHISLFTDAKKAGKDNIPVYLINVTGDYQRSVNSSGWLKKKSFTTYKLKKGKDYDVVDLGKAGIALTPKGNFDPTASDGVIFRNAEYTIPADYPYAGETLKKDKKVTELRVGIYNMSNKNYYVDSVEE